MKAASRQSPQLGLSDFGLRWSIADIEGRPMERLGRDAPLPEEMQGRWIDVEDPASELIIQGGEVTCFEQSVAYDYKVVNTDDGALTVSLKIDDQAKEDTFQRSNITELVITPDGDFHAYNVRFASQFERAESQPNGG
ncbi:hypothetical protein [Mesorhizobium sp.]|uniref:hypothetical protein n=1 Tax=Mesorhizobium sp. TaxID=1871066 RepID=UPI00257BBF7B|nr:hypothetical protein [Mesorhizobium sp.]